MSWTSLGRMVNETPGRVMCIGLAGKKGKTSLPVFVKRVMFRGGIHRGKVL
jgi:hypothetical protein